MKVVFDYLSEFEKRAKSLAKKYKSFPLDYQLFLDALEKDPFSGESLGHHTFKYRMTISSKSKGKSGGARVITYNVLRKSEDLVTITLMSIYDKGEIENISDSYLRQLIEKIKQNKI